ncbi:hypothetical protein [Cyanobacterium sp. Dongsha4]|uniref:hypothetical protein n=1 Tax=Cyanobacterium sp. DS4 TaxID=2878255 RepID=UPI002E80A1A0|nr:hypothetical protein [Cyanobacterium sp. Dongsha4]WVL00785.1 hypothetical protein Dongsha4_00890 [Cyanobacterium sp. Dongsha4]
MNTSSTVHKRKSEKVILLLTLTSGCILIPSFILLIASSWGIDDYFIAKLYQTENFHGLFNRIFFWSPRFFSEIVLYIYYRLVPFLGKPLTGGVNLITWLFLISSIFLFIRETLKQHSLVQQDVYVKLLIPLLVTFILLIYFLFSQNPGEMFYVTVVSSAYILTLGGIIFNLNFFINQSNSQHISRPYIFYLIIFGIITSSSWEMGAIYQLFFSTCLFLMLLLTTFSTKFNYLPFFHLDKFNRWKLSIANLIPFCLSLYILFLLKSHRTGTVEVIYIESTLRGNFQASMITSLWQFFQEIFFLNQPAWKTNLDFYSFSYSVVYKLGLLLLLIILFYQVKFKLDTVTRNACFLSILPLVTTNFIITFSSYYKFGIPSFPRQTSFKSALIGLLLLIIAFIISSWFSYRSDKLRIISILNSPINLIITFSLTFILLVNLQFKHLRQDLSNFNSIIVSNNQNWQENLGSDQSIANYTTIPTFYIFRTYLDDGIYPSCEKEERLNIFAERYANYFNKNKLYVIPFNSESSSLNVNISPKKANRIDFICSHSSDFGNVDSINQSEIKNSVFELVENQEIVLTGWAINPDKSKGKKVLITMGDDNKIIKETQVNLARPDVADYFNNPIYLDSGWSVSFIPTINASEDPVKFRVWSYDPIIKEAYLFKEFYLKFQES